MADGDIHELAPTLFVIEGHHPHRMYEDPDIATIAIYRSASTLYLMDSGVGRAQRDAILDVAKRLGPVDEVVLLNSHGHIDHLGNNDVIEEIAAGRKNHFFPRAGRPGLDPVPFFTAMYRRGGEYFNYLDGLDLDAHSMSALMRALGADERATPGALETLGAAIIAAGLAPALSKFLPSIVGEIIMTAYPPLELHLDGMRDYEELGPASEIAIGDTRWNGWDLGAGELQVMQTQGHSAGGCVFYVPEHRFMMFADETSPIPIWADGNPDNAIQTAQKALAMLDSGHLTTICAGHRPALPLANDDARASIRGTIAAAIEFSTVVETAIAEYPAGVSIDVLYQRLTTHAAPDSLITMLKKLQFPVFATFLKLTLLNHCLLHDFPQGLDDQNRITFRLPEPGTRVN